MTKQYILIFILFGLVAGCKNEMQIRQTFQADITLAKQNELTYNSSGNFAEIEINCDSIYIEKGISIKLIPTGRDSNNEPEFKFLFLVIKQHSGHITVIFNDTIESTIQEVKFADFNNDEVKDILIQYSSDTRSNRSYQLFIVGKNVSSVRKIKGFEEIKNPNYLPEFDLIDNLVISGRNWTSFYKIMGDTIKSFNIVIYDEGDEKGINTYDLEYKKAISKILKDEKTNIR